MLKIFSLVILSLVISGCENIQKTNNTAASVIKKNNIMLPMQPEALFDYSSERVSLPLASSESLDELTDWINNDVPSRADLGCAEQNENCRKAANILSSFKIPSRYLTQSSKDQEIVLIYDRIAVRDCNEIINNKGSNRPAFGCATSANMLHMITDYRQFIKPNLLGLQDASRSIQQYNNIYGSNSEFLE
jgi:hypothetical protein